MLLCESKEVCGGNNPFLGRDDVLVRFRNAVVRLEDDDDEFEDRVELSESEEAYPGVPGCPIALECNGFDLCACFLCVCVGIEVARGATRRPNKPLLLW